MAKKNADTLPQRVEPNTQMERPSFIPTSAEGTENIGRDDIQMPRMALAQKMSPEVDEDKPEYIDGLKVGALFNNVTHQIYGKGPMRFMVVRSDKPRYVEFIPREEGGGIKDFNVPANDPRTLFGPNGEKPVATKFYDFIVMLLDHNNELIALSLKGTGIKTAKRLNTFIKNRMPPVPIYAGVYTLRTDSETNALGTYSVYKVERAGFPETEELFTLAKNMHDSLVGKEIKIDREPGSDDTEFDTDNM